MSIDTLKSTIGGHKGFAMQNRFRVIVTPPNGIQINSEDLSILCESCVLPGRTLSTLDAQDVRQVVKIANGYTNEDLSFTFLLTQDYFIKTFFDKWLSRVIDFDKYRAKYQNEYTADMFIEQLDKGEPATTDKPATPENSVYRVKIQNAYPIAINSINFDNTAENTIQRVTVVMAFRDYKVEN